ncbi:50S ribosomal protein L29 [Candidatus Azambacteria bacterium]|nr:50S ribosomal protein L29 [Candidatus Azambacteria bacterium]
MTPNKLRQNSETELTNLLSENRKKVFEIVYHDQFKKTKNVKEVKNLKKDIARILTILGESK